MNDFLTAASPTNIMLDRDVPNTRTTRKGDEGIKTQGINSLIPLSLINGLVVVINER
jgi:hypothetical protein